MDYDFTYTGAEIQEILDTAKKLKDSGYIFLGVATPSTNPGTPTQKVYYEAKQAGTYTNFGGVVLPDGMSLLIWNGSWTSETVMSGDGGVFDISVYKSTGGTLATFADLSAALDGGNNIPASARKGGMSVKFVQSSDNNYVQYRLMSDTFSTTVTDWQGVDDELTPGSNNLVKSGVVFKKIGRICNKSSINSNERVNIFPVDFCQGDKFSFAITNCSEKLYGVYITTSNDYLVEHRVYTKEFSTDTYEYSFDWSCNTDAAKYIIILFVSGVTNVTFDFGILGDPNSRIQQLKDKFSFDYLLNRSNQLDNNTASCYNVLREIYIDGNFAVHSADDFLFYGVRYNSGSNLYNVAFIFSSEQTYHVVYNEETSIAGCKLYSVTVETAKLYFIIDWDAFKMFGCYWGTSVKVNLSAAKSLEKSPYIKAYLNGEQITNISTHLTTLENTFNTTQYKYLVNSNETGYGENLTKGARVLKELYIDRDFATRTDVLHFYGVRTKTGDSPKKQVAFIFHNSSVYDVLIEEDVNVTGCKLYKVTRDGANIYFIIDWDAYNLFGCYWEGNSVNVVLSAARSIEKSPYIKAYLLEKQLTLSGKTLAVLGDSIMMLMRSNPVVNNVSYLGSDGNTYSASEVECVVGKVVVQSDNSIVCTVVNSNQEGLDAQDWLRLKTTLGVSELINLGLGGATLSQNMVETDYPFNDNASNNIPDGLRTTSLPNEVKWLKRLTDAGEKPVPDIILIWLGTNNSTMPIIWDNENQRVKDLSAFEENYNTVINAAWDDIIADNQASLSLRRSIYGGLRFSLESLCRYYPNATIVLASPCQSRYNASKAYTTGTLGIIKDAMKKMADRYSCIFVDAYDESGIVDIFEKVKDGEGGRWYSDGVHPNSGGKILLSNFIAKRLNSLVFDKI